MQLVRSVLCNVVLGFLFFSSFSAFGLPQEPAFLFKGGLYFSDTQKKDLLHLYSLDFLQENQAKVILEETSLALFFQLTLDWTRAESYVRSQKNLSTYQTLKSVWKKVHTVALIDNTSSLPDLALTLSSASITTMTFSAKVQKNQQAQNWFQALKTRSQDLSFSFAFSTEALQPPSVIDISFDFVKINAYLKSLASSEKPKETAPTNKNLYTWLKYLLHKQAISVKRNQKPIPAEKFDALQPPQESAFTIEIQGSYRPAALSRLSPKQDPILLKIFEHILRVWRPFISLRSPKVEPSTTTQKPPQKRRWFSFFKKKPTPKASSKPTVRDTSYYWQTVVEKKHDTLQTRFSVQEQTKNELIQKRTIPWKHLFQTCQQCFFLP